MTVRISSLLCGGLLFGLLAPLAYSQTPVDVKPEDFSSDETAKAALPRLIKDLKSDDDKVRAKAVATLGAMGATAKPAAPALVETAVNFRGHADALKALANIDDESTRVALRKLLVGGTRRCKCGISFSDVVAAAGEPMVPHLIALLDDKEAGQNAEVTLVAIGEPAVAHLIRTFEGRCKVTVSPAVVRTFIKIGPKAKSATPALQEQLGFLSGPRSVRIAQALVAINGSHPAGFAVMHNALKSNDKEMKTEALSAFFELQAKSPELIPEAIGVLAGDDQQLYSTAMSVLQNIGKPAVKPLIDSLSKLDAKHSVHVMYTLSNLGDKASAAVPAFIKILDGNDAKLAILAAQCLPNFGPDAKKAVPHLVAGLESDNFTLRRACAQALVHLDRGQIAQTINPLIGILRGNNADERMPTVYLLGTLNAAARPAVPTLLEMLKSENLNDRMSIVQALTNIDNSQTDAMLPTLLEATQQKNSHLPRQAMQILGGFGPRVKTAAPALKNLLKESINGEAHLSPQVVIICLKKIDGMAEVMPVLIDGLNSKSAEEREEAQHLVLSFLRDSALQPLEAALANGQLQESVQVRNLMKQLRPKTAGAGK